MNPYSILMFCFSGALLLYAALLAVTKDYRMIARHYAVKVSDPKRYATQFAKLIALVAVAPAYSGLVALFSMGWAVAALIVEFVVTIMVGARFMED